ncbi:hypothetical protein AKJ16_DCAP20563 [Drosera capensis]
MKNTYKSLLSFIATPIQMREILIRRDIRQLLKPIQPIRYLLLQPQPMFGPLKPLKNRRLHRSIRSPLAFINHAKLLLFALSS